MICHGKIKRISGFKDSDLNKKPLRFKLIYSLINLNSYRVSMIEVETIFGKIVLR